MSETETSAEIQKPKTSKLAIASILIPTITTIVIPCFVIGFIAEAEGFWDTLMAISSFAILGSWPVGLILGIVALVVIKKSNGLLKGRGFAIAGVITSACFICGFTFLAAVVDYDTRDEVHSVICGTNLSGLGKAMLIYASGYDDKYPTADKWCDLLVKHTEVTEVWFVCPSAGKGRCHYAINPNASAVTHPDMAVLFETKGGWNQFGGPELVTFENHEGKGCNILFNDLHVEFVKPEQLGELKWKIEEGNTIK